VADLLDEHQADLRLVVAEGQVLGHAGVGQRRCAIDQAPVAGVDLAVAQRTRRVVGVGALGRVAWGTSTTVTGTVNGTASVGASVPPGDSDSRYA